MHENDFSEVLLEYIKGVQSQMVDPQSVSLPCPRLPHFLQVTDRLPVPHVRLNSRA